MTRLANWLGVLQSLVVITLAAAAVIFFFAPELRRFLEVQFNREAWYYVGKYLPSQEPRGGEDWTGGWEGGPELCPLDPHSGSRPPPERSFYHPIWEEDRAFNDRGLGERLAGRILISNDGVSPTPGRGAEADDDVPEAGLSDNPVVTLARPGQCYYVVEMVAKERFALDCNMTARPTRFWWMRGVRVTCE